LREIIRYNNEVEIVAGGIESVIENYCHLVGPSVINDASKSYYSGCNAINYITDQGRIASDFLYKGNISILS